MDTHISPKPRHCLSAAQFSHHSIHRAATPCLQPLPSHKTLFHNYTRTLIPTLIRTAPLPRFAHILFTPSTSVLFFSIPFLYRPKVYAFPNTSFPIYLAPALPTDQLSPKTVAADVHISFTKVATLFCFLCPPIHSRSQLPPLPNNAPSPLLSDRRCLDRFKIYCKFHSLYQTQDQLSNHIMETGCQVAAHGERSLLDCTTNVQVGAAGTLCQKRGHI